MRRFIFSVFVLSFMSYGAFAQNKPSCAILLCSEAYKNDSGNTNITSVFSGFNEAAVGKSEKFTVYVRFQGFSLNTVHRFYITLEDPKGKNILTTKEASFSFLSNLDIRAHTANWTVDFEMKGTYIIKVYVDDKEVERLYFGVGD
ncbi:MAG: hypothetical protein SFU27_14595 [Thermonemataceae bacterium]|nr:hypothetical protein [Thermonemataceae bacterium]